jgi:hypothetical protein
VALLRQVQVLPRALAHKIGCGLPQEDFREICESQPALCGCMSFAL